MSQEFLAVGNNLIPVDPATGGLAAMRGWRDADSGLLLTPVAGAVTIQPGKGAGTSGFVGVVEAPIPVDAGQPYTAGATSDHFAAIGIYWVGEDGQIIGNVRGFGEGRISVVGRAPDGATGALVAVFNPAVTPTVSNGVNTYTVAAFQVIQASPPIFILDPEQYVGAIVVSHPVLAAGITDPGPLDPAVLDLSWGKQVYTSLPEVYRHLDDGSLLDYLRAAGTVADEAEDLSDQVVSGLLTDPDLIPDELLGWSAQILGLNSNGSVPLRDLITARFASPYTGTRAAIAEFCKPYLTGSKVADVVPSSTPWTLVVRVRADEVVAITQAGLRARLLSSGQIPAGYDVVIMNATIPWANITALGTTWSAQDAQKSWAEKDSSGAVGV